MEILEQATASSSFTRSFYNTPTVISTSSTGEIDDIRTEDTNEEASEDTISKDESDDEKPKDTKEQKPSSGLFRGLRRGSVLSKSKSNISASNAPKKISGPKNVVISKPAAAGETTSSNTSSEADASPMPSPNTSANHNSSSLSPSFVDSSSTEAAPDTPEKKKVFKGPPKYSETEGKKLLFKVMVSYNRKRKFDNFFKDKQFRPGRTRIELLKEVLGTERTYVKMMEIFVSVFIEPIKKKTKVLDEAHQKAIFSNAEQILRVNTTLLMDLEKNWNKFPLCEMGPVFKRFALCS